MAIGTSLGEAIGLGGSATPPLGESLQAARMLMGEEDRKRKEQAKKDAEAEEKYANIISKLKVEGYDPIYNEEIKKRAADVIGTLQEGYKKNKYSDPYNNSEFTKKLQDFQIFSDEAKQATKALSEDYALTTGGKKKLKSELASALQANDYNAYQQALGGNKHYRRGAGIDDVEEPFDYVKLKGQVNNAFKPSESTIEIKDPATGLFKTTQNQYYNNPLAATAEVFASDPKTVEFFTTQYNALPVAKQKEFSNKAQAQGGSGNAYLEYAATRLFDNTGLKSKTTLHEPSGSGSAVPYSEFSGAGEVLPKPFTITDIPKGKKLIGKVEKFIPLKQEKIHKMVDPDGNVLEVYNVRKIFYDDGTVGYEGKIIEESRIRRKSKDEFGEIVETEELLPQYAPVVLPYDRNKQVELGEKGFPKDTTQSEAPTDKKSKSDLAVASFRKQFNREPSEAELKKIKDKYK